jgi:sugar lactone lactonase YvrE
VAATERGFVVLDREQRQVWQTELWPDAGLRMNDGGCDQAGRFYCGSMAYDALEGAGSLWRLDPDRSTHRIASGYTIPNGLVWSLGGDMVYHVDTPTGRIDGYRFDVRTATWQDRSTVAIVEGGAPDGMTIDAEGGLWVALWGGHAVHRYSPDGRLSAVVEVGPAQVSSCAFGGSEYSQLIITTSRQGLGASEDPEAGRVFWVEPGVVGVPPQEYAG